MNALRHLGKPMRIFGHRIPFVVFLGAMVFFAMLAVTGIALGYITFTRTTHIAVEDSMVVTPYPDQEITLYRGGEQTVDYQVQNTSGQDIFVTVGYRTPLPDGVTCVLSSENFTLAIGQTKGVSATYYASENATSGSVLLDFTNNLG